MTPRLAVTCGDPAGVGPEVALRALASVGDRVTATVFGPPELFRKLAGRFGLSLPRLVACGSGSEWKPSVESGRAALSSIEAALREVQGGRADALVTAPVSKRWIDAGGVPFTGHTEYLAARSGAGRTTMMFVSEPLKVSLATTHVPLREVPLRLSTQGLETTIRHTEAAARTWFGVGSPRIAVAGLNPHAGEGGVFGREEEEIVRPAVDGARSRGIDCTGPWSGDTIFRRAVQREFDAVVALYHDQGLAAVKTIAPGAVNLTLGLPFIRTSPDHGTAFDIAGQGKADAGGMEEAIRLAAAMVLRGTPLFG